MIYNVTVQKISRFSNPLKSHAVTFFVHAIVFLFQDLGKNCFLIL